MSRVPCLRMLGLVGLLMAASSAWGQQYIGFVYPAGGQQGTTFQAQVGGQRLDYVDGVRITGEGVSARLVHFYRRIGNQDVNLLREQLRDLKRGKSVIAPEMADMLSSIELPTIVPTEKPTARVSRRRKRSPVTKEDKAKQKLTERLEKRISAYVNRPACRSISELAFIEVTVAPDARPGRREIRLVTKRGVSNALPFYIGQVPEVARKPMKTCYTQVLGKEYLAQRKRPPEEEEVRITVPCTMNGQIASGELNRYRFNGRKGQRLVVTVKARQLVPYIADAVPGWFQPVLMLCDADGKELAYNDDFRFKPDPTLCFDVPRDGEYVLTITDAIYRGREDFVYRITIGELPFVTSIFPLGARVGEPVKIEMNGWNLGKARLAPPPEDAGPGTYQIVAKKGQTFTNYVPFALNTLPECFDQEANNKPSQAQKVKLPVIVNGRIDRLDDWDVFEVQGKADASIVAEVYARRLDSPVDSFLKLTDAKGKLLAFNDDHQDAASGLNTHHADSYLMVKLPADGKYYIHIGDTARNGGQEYAYRLRISAPRPDFELRVVPPSVAIRSKSAAGVSVYALRKDGFDGAIKLSFKELPKGLFSSPAILPASKNVGRLVVKTKLRAMEEPVNLVVVGSAKVGNRQLTHEAVPAEDRMQAFLWRHLVPAEDLPALVYSNSYRPPDKRVRPPMPEKPKSGEPAKKAKFSKRQVAGRMRQIERLYQDWLLTDDFANRKIAELEGAY